MSLPLLQSFKPDLVVRHIHRKDPFEMLGYCMRRGYESGWSAEEKKEFLRAATKSREELWAAAENYFTIHWEDH